MIIPATPTITATNQVLFLVGLISSGSPLVKKIVVYYSAPEIKLEVSRVDLGLLIYTEIPNSGLVCGQ
jgi:hypothetical protein